MEGREIPAVSTSTLFDRTAAAVEAEEPPALESPESEA